MYRNNETTGPVTRQLSDETVGEFRRAYRTKNKAAAIIAGKRLSFSPKSPTVCSAEV